MRTVRASSLLSALAVVSMLAAACGNPNAVPPGEPGADAGDNGGGGGTGDGGSGGGGNEDGGGGATDAGTPGEDGGMTGMDAGFSGIPYVFVIAMENKNDTGVYGNSGAPYINDTLMKQYAYSSDYEDVLSSIIPSEPHYVWLEAATNSFSDYAFYSDSDPGSFNSTDSTEHIATQLKTANNGRTWRSYQEGLDPATTGACPIKSNGFYAAKHDPFVFFTDVAGSPPAKDTADCAAHHRPYVPADFQKDLELGDVAAYTFITPNLCNDMHGAGSCQNGCTSGTAPACVGAGDSWLAANVPPIIDFMSKHGGVLFIVWDEPEAQPTQPFLVVGPHVKAGYPSAVKYSHSSYVKTLDQILRLPVLDKAKGANDFSDFFETGFYP